MAQPSLDKPEAGRKCINVVIIKERIAVKRLITDKDQKKLYKTFPWSLFHCSYKQHPRNTIFLGHFVQTPVNNPLKSTNNTNPEVLLQLCRIKNSNLEAKVLCKSDTMQVFLIVHAGTRKTTEFPTSIFFTTFLWELQNSMTIDDLSS